ncbi:MAG: hypothetical protein COV67_04640 [Nitrospinae bacterium CG11_big_fil_rev_8_21_14_0_20_56_8]|nr:MAG: hypothetical protein COV67_04640 [Nitrospinae bacterium CG11_big_fil_rev_8_21_14_0_20_56_8]
MLPVRIKCEIFDIYLLRYLPQQEPCSVAALKFAALLQCLVGIGFALGRTNVLAARRSAATTKRTIVTALLRDALAQLHQNLLAQTCRRIFAREHPRLVAQRPTLFFRTAAGQRDQRKAHNTKCFENSFIEHWRSLFLDNVGSPCKGVPFWKRSEIKGGAAPCFHKDAAALPLE